MQLHQRPLEIVIEGNVVAHNIYVIHCIQFYHVECSIGPVNKKKLLSITKT